MKSESWQEILYASYREHPSHGEDLHGRDLDVVYGAHLKGWLPERRDLPILDLGCGSGSLLAFLCRQGFEQLVGVDREDHQVEAAGRVAPGATLMVGRAGEHLAKHPGRYGTIFCMDLLEHLVRDELVGTLKQAQRALRPGGWLVARVPNADSPFEGAIRYGDPTHEGSFGPPALVHLLRSTGFASIEFREAAPVVKGLKSGIRAALWRVLRQLVRIWNLVETGSPGAGVYTRIIYVRAQKPDEARR